MSIGECFTYCTYVSVIRESWYGEGGYGVEVGARRFIGDEMFFLHNVKQLLCAECEEGVGLDWIRSVSLVQACYINVVLVFFFFFVWIKGLRLRLRD